MSHWSNNFIQWLKKVSFDYPTGQDYLRLCIEELIQHRKRQLDIIRLLRHYCREYHLMDCIDWLRSVPGIGFATAMSFYSELIDIKRFPNLNHLASYVGLVESVHSSDTRDPDLVLRDDGTDTFDTLSLKRPGWQYAKIRLSCISIMPLPVV